MHLFLVYVFGAYSAEALVTHFTIDTCVHPGNLSAYTLPEVSRKVSFILKYLVTTNTLVCVRVRVRVRQLLPPVLLYNVHTLGIPSLSAR